MSTHHASAVLVGDVETFAVDAYVATTEQVDQFWSQIGIDEVREITRQAFLRPATAAAKTLVIRSNFITHEAQNALLKLLEEPPADTTFLLVQPIDFQFLATIQSRLAHIEVVAVSGGHDWRTFAAATINERLSLIDTAAKAKDKAWMLRIKHGLLDYVAHHITAVPVPDMLRLQLVADRLLTRGASNKMLLEELALTLPVQSV